MKPIEGPIRWGIAGTGGIAASFATDFARLDDGELVRVSSRSADSAAHFATTHGIARAADSHEELAADPDVDIVYVAGIHPVHEPHTLLFLEAGKHVLVEKPIALDASATDRMISAAHANDRFLMEAMWMRFNPTHVEVVRRIADGAIGDVRRIHADFSFAIPFDSEHRLWNRAAGGGALLDVGIYPVHLAWWVLGPPDDITVTSHLADSGVDDEIALFCSWGGGATALLTAGIRLAGSMSARIEGTEGTIELPFPAHACDRAVLQRGTRREEIVGGPAGLHHQVVEVHRCLRAGEPESPTMTLATSAAVMTRFDGIRAEIGVDYTG